MIYSKLYILSVLCFIVNGNVTITSYRTYRHLPQDCGKTRLGVPRIIDGDIAELGQFPWMARIGIKKWEKTAFHCAGSLINRYYVVTAANCRFHLGNIVRLGENYLGTSKDCNHGVCAPLPQDIWIRRFTPHKDYCSSRDTNDIALIELSAAAKFDDFVQPICFPREILGSDDLFKEPAIIAGWGLTKSDPKRSPCCLMYILAPAVDKSACDVLYQRELEDYQLCMGYMKGKDSCHGDSGGPVFKYMRSDEGQMRVFLRGVVSYGLQICGKGPAVYTDVSHFAEWAMDIIYKS